MSSKKSTSAADAARSRNPFAHAAPAYAKRGWAVLPAHIPKGKRCSCSKGKKCGRSAGKHPRITDPINSATTSLEQIRKWIAYFGPSNISIATGERSGFMVLDIDPRHDGDVNLPKLEKRLGKLPDTMKVRSGGGGWHLYFQWPGERVKSVSDIGRELLGLERTGVDVKADGGIIMAPPSLHVSGKRYTFQRETPLAKLPKKWRKFLLGTAKASKPAVSKPKHETSKPVAFDGPAPSLIPIRDGCGWLKHCKDDAKTLPEAEWYAMLSIVGRTKGGAKHAHKWSGPHPDYSKKETDGKLAHALAAAGPRTCADISANCGGKRYCKACPHAGKITSPIQLGRESNLPPGYTVKGNHLLYVKDDKAYPVSDNLEVIAMTRDFDSSTWGRMLRWADHDQKQHEMVMSAESMLEAPSVAVKPLARDGLHIQSPKLLIGFIQGMKPALRQRLVKRAGWQGDHRTYVLPGGEIISATTGGDPIRLEAEATKVPVESGTLESWQKEVAALCEGNSRALFAVSTAFAAYILPLVNAESGGFHLRGESSKGKSTVQALAASVGGLEMETWLATSNGLEAIAARHNDALMWLDELGQTDPSDAGAMAYMLASGQGKARMTKDAAARKVLTWRLLFLSSGEFSLATHLASGGKTARAGMDARMPDVPAIVEGGHGVVEHLHGYENGHHLVERMKLVAREHRGTAGPAFLRRLVKNIDEAKQYVQKRCDSFMRKQVPEGADGQVQRVAKRFALVAAAGELAIRYGVVPWEKGAARAGVVTCFRAWLDARGSVEAGEGTKMLGLVRGFLDKFGSARFTKCVGTKLVDSKLVQHNRAGFLRIVDGEPVEYAILPSVWQGEVCAGFDAGDVARTMIRLGHLKTDKDGKAPSVERLPGMGTTRAYIIRLSIFQDAPVKKREGKAT